ncbi:DUF2635 domain-containing protein [Roseomonas nepalensis]|uniref:DUF2635 domain-containing protein n=1 Tax=Muricoccus nepalensis TaxID=1854500 RepID=A0A502FUH4_9PROT|nr:DUF2635 domain-containing protein [Roseomonas nepalensis]TPG53267.1 DUF2635 domain-containing protein [Roseomonas nepalensis]
MHVKPARGMQIPDPELRDYLPKEGRKVTPSEYWTRRISEGDVKEISPPEEPAPEAAGPQADAGSVPTTAPRGTARSKE